MVAAESFGGRVLAVLSRRALAFRPPNQSTGRIASTWQRNAGASPGDLTFSESLLALGYNLDRRLDVRISAFESDAIRISLRGINVATFASLVKVHSSLIAASSYMSSSRIESSSRTLRWRQERGVSAIQQAADYASEATSHFISVPLGWGGWDRLLAMQQLASNLDRMAWAVAGIPRRDLREELQVVSSQIRPLRITIERALTRLTKITDDFTGADLSDANIEGIDLTDLKWSESTIWPPGWADRVRRSSDEKSPGVYVVKPSGGGSNWSRMLGV